MILKIFGRMPLIFVNYLRMEKHTSKSLQLQLKLVPSPKLACMACISFYPMETIWLEVNDIH